MRMAGGWNRWIVAAAVALVAAVLPLGIAEAAPMSRIWVGPPDGLWSVAENWDPAGVPADGDSIVLPRPSTSRFDIDGLQVDWIVSDRPPGSGGNDGSVSTVNGASMELAGGISVQGGSGRLQLDVPLVLASGVHVLEAESPSNILGIGGPVTGSGGLALQGNIGRVELLGSNTYSGGTSVATVAVVGGTSPLGTGAVSVVGVWGSLEAAAGTVIPNPVSVAAAPVFLTATGSTTFTGLVEASIDDTAVEVAAGALVSFEAGLQADGFVSFRPPADSSSGGRIELGGVSVVASLGAAQVEVDITTAAGSQAIGQVGAAGTAQHRGVVNFLADEQHDPATNLGVNLPGVIDLWGTDQRADRVQVLSGILYLGYWHEPDQHRRSTLTAESLDTYGSSTTVWTIDDAAADLIRASSVRLGGDLQFYVSGNTPMGHEVELIDNVGLGPVQGTFNGGLEGYYHGTTDGQVFQISYVGDDGNDVTLTKVGDVATSWEFDGLVDFGGRSHEPPALSSWGPGRLDAFVTGTDGTLWHTPNNGGWWEWLGGRSASGPAAASQGFGTVDVFLRGTDNQLWMRSYRGGWQPWQSLGGFITEAPAVTSHRPGSLDVMARGSDGQVWHRAMRNNVWQAWQSLGGYTTHAPTIADEGSGNLDVFVRGGDGQVWHSTGGWDAWVPLGGQIVDGPAVAATEAGKWVLFAPAPDGRLWLRQSLEFGGWQAWANTGHEVAERVAAVGQGPDDLAVGFRTPHGSLGVLQADQFTASPGTVAAASAAAGAAPSGREGASHSGAPFGP